MKRLTTPFLALVVIALMAVGAQAAWNLQQKPDGSAVWRNSLTPEGGGLQEWPVGRVVLSVPFDAIQAGASQFVVSPITGVLKAAWYTTRSIAAATISLQMLYEAVTNGTFSAISPTFAVLATQAVGFVTGIGEGSQIAISTTGYSVRQYRPIAVRSLSATANGGTTVNGVLTVVIDPY